MPLKIEFCGHLPIANHKTIKRDLSKRVTDIFASLNYFSFKELGAICRYDFTVTKFFQIDIIEKIIGDVPIVYGDGLKFFSYIYICSDETAFFDYTIYR